MPPCIKFSKENIEQAAFNIVRTKGLDMLTARRIAQEMGCSTRPIYAAYENMQQLQDAIIQKATKYAFSEITSFKITNQNFKNMGLGYLKFAKNEKHLFRALFLSNKTKIDFNNGKNLFSNEEQLKLMKQDEIFDGFTDTQLQKLLIRMWIYVHGIATSIATNSAQISDEKAEELIEEMFIINFLFEKNGGVITNNISTRLD